MATARHTCLSALLEKAAPATAPVRLEVLHRTVGVARVDFARRVPLHLDAVRVREAVADGVVFGAGQAIDHVRGATTAALPARCHGHDASGCRGWGRGPAVLLKYGSNAHDVVEGTHADDPGPIGSLRKLLGDR